MANRMPGSLDCGYMGEYAQVKPPKPKKCKVCKQEFRPKTTIQKVCGMKCAIEHGKNEQEARMRRLERETRRSNRAEREKLKTRSEWMREAQAAFNAYIRERDKGLPCISCQRFHTGQSHAGHYRTTKAAPELRFNPLNCHLQCAPCNNHLSGNIVEYRIHLKNRIGQANLDWLEGPHQLQNLTIDDIKEIKSYYKEQLKRLRHESI